MKKQRNSFNIIRNRINRAVDFIAIRYLYNNMTRDEMLELIDILTGKDLRRNYKGRETEDE